MKAVDITENPAGVDRKVKEQLERKKIECAECEKRLERLVKRRKVV